MADIDIEHKSSHSWIWWMLGLIALAMVIWFLASGGQDEIAMEPAEEVATEMQPTTTAPQTGATVVAIPVIQIQTTPASWIGRTVSGEVEVVEVPTDRGFWIEHEGRRLFAVLIDNPNEDPVDVNTGQKLRLENATVRDTTYVEQMPGEPLDADTRAILASQPVYIVVDESNVEILGQANGANGANGASGTPSTGATSTDSM